MTDPINPRSLLFIPADNDKFVAKAHQRGADIIILDLEDSIPLEQKASARQTINSALQQLKAVNQAVAVRINGDPSSRTQDLQAIDLSSVSLLLLPKVEQTVEIEQVDQLLSELEQQQSIANGQTQLVVMLESATGVLNAAALAKASSRVLALAIGSEDLSAELGCEPTTNALLYSCQQMKLASAAANIQAWGFPGSISEYSDLDKLEAQLNLARELGFSAALCIHPAQIALVNQVFSYTDEQRAWAQRVVNAMADAEKQGRGVCRVDGRMVDAPVVARARRILATAFIQ